MKRKKYITFVAALLFALPLCLQAQSEQEPKTGKTADKSNPAVKLIQRIVGSWKIQSQIEGNAVTKNPTSGEWIEFRPDGKYVNKTAQPDSGSYRLNEPQGILYLESQVASAAQGKQVTEYNIKMSNNDTMTLQPRAGKNESGSEKPKNAKQGNKTDKTNPGKTKFVYVRISQETSSVK